MEREKINEALTERDSAIFCERSFLSEKQQLCRAKIRFEGDGDVTEVLSVSARVVRVFCEALMGEARVSYTVFFEAIAKNALGALVSSSVTADASESILDGSVNPRTRFYCDLFPTEIKSEGVSGKTCDVYALTAINCIAVNDNETGSVTNEDSVMTKREEIDVDAHCCVAEAEVNESCEFEIRDTASKLLSVDARVCDVRCSADDGSFAVTGNVKVTALVESPSGGIETLVKNLRLDERIMANGVRSDCVASCKCLIGEPFADVIADTEKNNLTANVEFSVNASIFAVHRSLVEVVTDAFSIKGQSALTKRTLKASRLVESFSKSVKLDGMVNVGNGSENRRALCVPSAYAVVSGIKREGSEYFVMGTLCATVLFADGDLGVRSEYAETPFSVSLGVFAFGTKLVVSAGVDEVFARSEGGGAFSISGTLCISAESFTLSETEVITGVTVEKEGEQKCGFSVYFCDESDCLFDACKALGADERTVLGQNKEGEIAASRRVTCFRGCAES